MSVDTTTQSDTPQPSDELGKQLRKYNWSSDKDYQLAVIAFRELLTAHTNTHPVEEGKKRVYLLWKLLDDIDTLDDAVKSDDKAFRKHVRTIQRKRFDIVPESQVDELYNQFHQGCDHNHEGLVRVAHIQAIKEKWSK